MSLSPLFLRRVLKMDGHRKSALDLAHGRLVLVSLFFAVAFMIISARLFDVSIIQGELRGFDVSATENTPTDTQQSDTLRSDITDRNGVLLATSLDTASLFADPSLIPEKEKTAKDLTRLFPDMAYGETLQKLQKDGRFVWVRRNMTPGEQAAVLELGQPGLQFRTEHRRIYPQENLATHIVGYTDVDGHGLGGIERSFDKLLQEGKEPLALTLDVRLQHIMHRELQKAISTFNAIGGAGMIMDVENGEVLAAVSLPDFDPHIPSSANDDKLFNRLTLGVYEMGSTFKIFSTAALLETQHVGMAQTFDTTKPLHRGRFTISDYHPEKFRMTVPEVFMHSSNIGAALMGEMMGSATLQKFYGDLGLLHQVSIEIDEVGKPMLPRPWGELSTLTASFGHGISVTPLQTVAAASSIVNGGIRVNPTLILDRAVEEIDKAQTRVVSAETAHRMRQLLRLVVTDGTATQADVVGYNVGGKTGTAEKIVNGRYAKGKNISSFIGFFPIDAPRYAILVMVDEPKGTKKSYGFATGGWVAAPAAGRIVESMSPLLGMKPNAVRPETDIATPLKKYLHSYEDDAANNGGEVAQR